MENGMKIHPGSVLFGSALTAGVMILGPQLRPILVDIATAGIRSLDRLASRLSITREDLEDLLAEARARARSSEPVSPLVRPS
jgi:hypothetical protein